MNKNKKGAVLLMVVVIFQLVIILTTLILTLAFNGRKQSIKVNDRVDEAIILEKIGNDFVKGVNLPDCETYFYGNYKIVLSDANNTLKVLKDGNIDNVVLYVNKADTDSIVWKYKDETP